MEETLIEIYVVPFMSQEWIAWTLFSIVFISTPLILARFLNKSQKRMVTYIMGILLIIDFFAENIGYIANDVWSIEYNLPLQLCGISSLICCFLPFIKNKQKLFQFVFYTGIIGGFMAILTPQMNYFDGTIRYYLNYYVSHSLIIVMPIFMFLHLDLKLPRLSWFRLWINLNILMVFHLCNYFYYKIIYNQLPVLSLLFQILLLIFVFSLPCSIYIHQLFFLQF